jgi:hypothetical protein
MEHGTGQIVAQTKTEASEVLLFSYLSRDKLAGTLLDPRVKPTMPVPNYNMTLAANVGAEFASKQGNMSHSPHSTPRWPTCNLL